MWGWLQAIVHGGTKAVADEVVEQVEKPKTLESAQTTDADRADFESAMAKRLCQNSSDKPNGHSQDG